MAESNINKEITEVVPNTIVNSDLFSLANVVALKYGKVVVVSYHLQLKSGSTVSRNDVLATFDLPSNCRANCYNQNDYNVAVLGGTKSLTADQSVPSGGLIRGQIVFIIY